MASITLLAPQIRLTIGIPAQVDDLPHVRAIPRDTEEVNDVWGRGEVYGHLNGPEPQLFLASSKPKFKDSDVSSFPRRLSSGRVFILSNSTYLLF